jgi:hypothetical protein
LLLWRRELRRGTTKGIEAAGWSTKLFESRGRWTLKDACWLRGLPMRLLRSRHLLLNFLGRRPALEEILVVESWREFWTSLLLLLSLGGGSFTLFAVHLCFTLLVYL